MSRIDRNNIVTQVPKEISTASELSGFDFFLSDDTSNDLGGTKGTSLWFVIPLSDNRHPERRVCCIAGPQTGAVEQASHVSGCIKVGSLVRKGSLS